MLPVICFFFDPIVFQSRTGGFSGAILGSYKPFAYVLSYVAIMGLLLFLLCGKKLKWANGALSGLFFLCSAISLAIGIVLAPFSLLGLIILIGALGFTPLFTAFVFARNSVRAYRAAATSIDKRLLLRLASLSTIMSFCLPYVFNAQVDQSLKTMISGDAQITKAAGERLSYIASLVNFDSVIKASLETERDQESRNALAEAYLELTGEDIVRAQRRFRTDSF
jgi:hypothetical protein